MNKRKPKEQVESDALKLHREMYEKRRKSLEDVQVTENDKCTEDQEETDRESEEEAALLNA